MRYNLNLVIKSYLQLEILLVKSLWCLVRVVMVLQKVGFTSHIADMISSLL